VAKHKPVGVAGWETELHKPYFSPVSRPAAPNWYVKLHFRLLASQTNSQSDGARLLGPERHTRGIGVGVLVSVEVLVSVSCALLAALVFVGTGRRTSRSAAFRFVVWLALMLCYPAVSYTIGLMQSGSFHNDLVVVWACFLLGCADGIFACSVDQSDQWARTVLNQATQVVYVLFLLAWYVASLELQLKILLLLLWALNVAKLGMRVWSLLSADCDRVLTADNWLVSKYMGDEDVRRSVWDFDPETMRGYKYAVTGEKDVKDGCVEYRREVTADLVTVDRVWTNGGSLLSRDDTFSSRLKDQCLSFALFKLLRRRLASGNPLHERDDIRTLVFVRRGLAGGDDYERMFRVVEMELGFLFDFFYTRYPSPKQPLIPESATFVVAMAVGLSTLFSPALLHYHHKASIVRQHGIDIWLARCVIVLFLILETFQYLSLVLSDWHKVKMLCRYVHRPSWQGHPVLERLLWLMCRAAPRNKYWSNSVGQYSLLHACLQNERSCLARIAFHKWIKGQLTRMRTVSRRSLPTSVKREIHLFLRSEWLSNLKYGDRILQRNNLLQDFDWSTSRYHYGAVGSILVWHLATAICDAKAGGGRTAITDKRQAATTLSKYCAYLLFQEPDLVTEQVHDVRLLMEALQLRVQELLRKEGCRSKDDMFNKLSGFQPHELAEGGYEKSILDDGIKLGDQIPNDIPDEAVRWIVLAEMWVELLLSVAPSDNVTAHVEKLATGGELITHLWALLTHGGIIDKPKKPYYGPD
jgi:hypothetical protein